MMIVWAELIWQGSILGVVVTGAVIGYARGDVRPAQHPPAPLQRSLHPDVVIAAPASELVVQLDHSLRDLVVVNDQ